MFSRTGVFWMKGHWISSHFSGVKGPYIDLTLTAGGRLPLLSASHHYCMSESDRWEQKSLYSGTEELSVERTACILLCWFFFSDISVLFDMSLTALWTICFKFFSCRALFEPSLLGVFLLWKVHCCYFLMVILGHLLMWRVQHLTLEEFYGFSFKIIILF